jgi:hypothetical protein
LIPLSRPMETTYASSISFGVTGALPQRCCCAVIVQAAVAIEVDGAWRGLSSARRRPVAPSRSGASEMRNGSRGGFTGSSLRLDDGCAKRITQQRWAPEISATLAADLDGPCMGVGRGGAVPGFLRDLIYYVS